MSNSPLQPEPLPSAIGLVPTALPAQPRALAPSAVPAESDAAHAEREGYEVPLSIGEDRVLLVAVPSWFVSAIVHAMVLILLGLFYVTPPTMSERQVIVAAPADLSPDAIEDFKPLQPQSEIDIASETAEAPEQPTQELVNPISDLQPGFADPEAAPSTLDLNDFGEATAPREDLAKTIGGNAGSGLSGRSPAARGELLKAGGNDASEAAVASALRWFKLHQRPDGSWSFDHRYGPCKTNPGTLTDGLNGATGLALLPFLGAGQTHLEGEYKNEVKAGLAYLMRNMKVKSGTLGDLSDGGNMYSHGICAIALCEAYAMTHDKELLPAAQAAVNYIVFAQDPIGGGWRYNPKEPGDTSVLGWQLMALKSGHLAYLHVPPNTVKGASLFLDSMQVDGGAAYGYTRPDARPSTTAVGLLSRMYLGWKKETPGLVRGVQALSERGPSFKPGSPPGADMYYNYYATQVMRHYGGDEWARWNTAMRDPLINSQAKSGAEKGSWFFGGNLDHGSERGGRIYCTSMATMVLEVYYRHLPLYGKQASEEDFPL